MPPPETEARGGELPSVLVIGAMKAGTTALHRYLGAHPEIGMAPRKELNFFFGTEDAAGRTPGAGARAGNWWRGIEWYRRQFPDAPVRGEASPGYTSPSFPEAARRIASVIPRIRLVYAVRDPIERAVSQYRHHRADGTEGRDLADALLDPDSQYLSRSRFCARLEPYLARFERDQLLICAQEELLHDRARTLRSLYRFLGVDESFRGGVDEPRPACTRRSESVDNALRRRLASTLAPDAAGLRELAGRDFLGWSV